MKKQTLAVGQEWEKQDNNRMGSTRVRILSSPGTRTRVKVGTVTADGRVIRQRPMLVSAFNGTPSGYQLVKTAPSTGIPVEHEPREVPAGDVVEACCFCAKGTRYWTKLPDRTPGQQVACCEVCAKKHRPEQVPTKAAWWVAARSARALGKASRAPVTDPTPFHAALDRWLQEQTSGATPSDPMDTLRKFIHHPDAPEGTETWEAARADARLAMLAVGQRIHALENVAREVAALAQATGNSRAMGWAAKLTAVLEGKS